MSLDLGELRAGVVIDRSQVRPGLADVRRKFEDFTRGMSADADKGGKAAGANLGEGISTGTRTRLQMLRDHFRRSTKGLEDEGQRSGERTGRNMGQALQDRLRTTLRSVPELGKQAGRGLGQGMVYTLKSTLGVGAHGLGGVLSMAGRGIASFAAGGVLALGTVAAAGAAIGTKVASANEQASISFTTMLRKGNDTTAQAEARSEQFITKLQKFAAETPFEFSDMQHYSASLISAGIDADKVIPIMRNLGDVTAGVGTGAEGIDRATVAIQQMIAAGRIQAEDLNQLRDAGIPVYDLLAGATGKSKKEIAELAQTGKLGKRELDALLRSLSSDAPKGLERFSGLMDQQSHSLSGIISTFKDTFSQGLGGVMQNALPLIKDGVTAVSTQAGRLFGYLNDHQDDIGSIFRTAGQLLKNFGGIAGPVLGAFFGDLTDGQDALTGVADWFSTHQEDITGFLIGGAQAAITFGKGMLSVSTGVLRAYAGLADGVGTSLDFLLGKFITFTRFQAKVMEAIPGMGHVADSLNAAADGMQRMRDQNARDDGGAAKAREMADALDHSLGPALDSAQDKLDKVGKTKLDSAFLRDQAAGVANAIGSIGTEADGSKVKLKRWTDVSKLGADEQKALRGRIGNAHDALVDQLTAMRDAGAGQETLTKTWKTGRERLYDEFKQMGLSDDAARKLADRYAKVPAKVRTAVSAPGLKTTSDDTQTLADRVRKIKDRDALLNITVKTNAGAVARQLGMSKANLLQNFAGGGTFGVLPGYTPGRDVHRFLSPTGGELNLSGGESIMRPEWTRAVGGPAEVERQNRLARSGKLPEQHFAQGGTYQTQTRVEGQHNGTTVVPGTFADRSNQKAFDAAEQWADVVGRAMQQSVKTIQGRLAGASAGFIDVSNPKGRTTYRGGTFTNLFAANLRRAEKIGHGTIHLYQGGFRPATSYSGTSHRGDALDMSVNYSLGKALRAVGIASGDRTGLGNWAPHIHAIPGPGAGYAAGSAVWQWGDYKRRGGASQSMRSPWGLYTGHPSAPPGFNWTAEKGAELVVNPQLRDYKGGEKVIAAKPTADLLSGRRDGSLIGTVNLTTTDKARDAVGDLMYAVRSYDRGGKP